MIKNFLKKIVPNKLIDEYWKIINLYFDRYARKSYSQEGEDLILKRIFEGKENGFYVDVGAHHPLRFSNTYIFYKLGWRGINIDAMPKSMVYFDKIRPNDINIETPVSDRQQTLTYYAFNEPALNGFSEKLSIERNKKDGYKIIFRKEMVTKTLAQVLDQYLPKSQTINFLTIDVEGLDFSVLKSNDWEKYTPEVVLVEILGSSLEDINASEITSFMKKKGYIIFAKTYHTVFFKLENSRDNGN